MTEPDNEEDLTRRRELPALGQRRSGVLLHVTSLPGSYGVGDLGREALGFVEFLAASGQAWWQMLPVGPLGPEHVPYMARSAFAIGPHLLDLEAFQRDGYLSSEDLEPGRASGAVDWDALARSREPLFRKAADAFFRVARPPEREAFEEFCRRESSWLADYTLFCALKEAHGEASWTSWEPDVRSRDAHALDRARRTLADSVKRHAFLQFELARQWDELRAFCRIRGIGLIGDLPIFVAHESADVWAHPEIFQLDEQGQPSVVAGVPPDYFSATGQRWGHPLYRWQVLRERDYDWWMDRFRRILALFEVVRIDHFIGFARYWEIPAECSDAVAGRWQPGPSDHFFERFVREFGRAPVIAEDLGAVDEDVVGLRDRWELPGMRVLQFAFGSDPANDHLPHRHIRRAVVYPGTHDNDPTAGWFDELTGDASAKMEREYLLRYLAVSGKEIHWDLVRAAMASVADLAIIPAQDLLGLGSEARVNRPSETTGNWRWRLMPGALDERIAARLRVLTETYGRLPQASI